MSLTGPLRAVRRLAVPWPTAAVLATLLAYATGFWLTSLQGAVGAIANAQSPFANWLLHSTLMLPVYLAAVVATLTLAQRRPGPAGARARTATTGLLVATAATLVGLLQVAASAVYDYRLQAAEIEQGRSSHIHTLTPDPTVPCDATCTAKDLTLAADVRGVALIAGVLLLPDVVIVGWVVALRGGRLGSTSRPGLVGTGPVR